jgi:uncharacterized damage-inducible protein DinB
MNHPALDQFETSPRTLKEAAQGLARTELLAHPVPGTWSIQEIVIHLVDSDLVFTDRMKRVIAEENPPLMAFSENQWAGGLFYAEQSVEDALLMLELNHRQMARVLRKLPDSALGRKGTHNQAGEKTLLQLIESANNHIEHHLKFLREKRKMLGK